MLQELIAAPDALLQLDGNITDAFASESAESGAEGPKAEGCAEGKTAETADRSCSELRAES